MIPLYIQPTEDLGRIYINSHTEEAAYELGQALKDSIYRARLTFSDVVIMCIGTDRATGDALGPLTGHLLEPKLGHKTFLYGSLNRPVHAKNLNKYLDYIDRHHRKSLVLAVDAALGRISHVGFLSVGTGAISPGAGIGRPLPQVGHVAISGIVNFAGVMEGLVIQSTRLNLVMRMAGVIAEGIMIGLEDIL